MKKIAVKLDDETYCRVRMIAAQQGTTVSALVGHLLRDLGSRDREAVRLKRRESALRESITAFEAADRLSREDAHDRRY